MSLFFVFLGNFLTISSSKSPVPEPLVAEIGIGWPRPSLWNSEKSKSVDDLEILLTARIIGFFDLRRILATFLS